jgi:hypothetical protein
MGCDTNGNNCTLAGTSGGWGMVIWEFGYDPTHFAMNPEPSVYNTAIRDGNYDFLTNSQRWHNTPATFAMPNSLYLSSAPSFFTGTTCQYSGSTPWPWSNPATGAVNYLPAKSRCDCGTP